MLYAKKIAIKLFYENKNYRFREFSMRTEDKIVLLDIHITICSISVLGSLLIIFFYWYLQQRRKSFTFSVIFNIALTDFLLWSLRLIESIHNRILGYIFNEFTGLCEIFGYLQVTLALSNFIWVAIMSYCIYQTIVHRAESFNHLRPKLYVTSCFAPAAVSFIPVFTQSYGPTDEIKCWIVGSSEDILSSIVGLMIFYVPLLFVIIYSFWVIYHVRDILKSSIREENSSEMVNPKAKKIIIRIINQLMYYPLALIACYFFPLIHRIINTVDAPAGNSFWLLVLHYLSGPLQGFFNAVVYGTSNKDVRILLSRWIKCRCLKKKKIERKKDNQEPFVDSDTIPPVEETTISLKSDVADSYDKFYEKL